MPPTLYLPVSLKRVNDNCNSTVIIDNGENHVMLDFSLRYIKLMPIHPS